MHLYIHRRQSITDALRTHTHLQSRLYACQHSSGVRNRRWFSLYFSWSPSAVCMLEWQPRETLNLLAFLLAIVHVLNSGLYDAKRIDDDSLNFFCEEKRTNENNRHSFVYLFFCCEAWVVYLFSHSSFVSFLRSSPFRFFLTCSFVLCSYVFVQQIFCISQ